MTLSDKLYQKWMLEKFEPTKVSSIGKVMPLEVALSKYIKPGMSLHFAYSQGRPMAASNALVRVFKGKDPKFTFISSGIVANQTALVKEIAELKPDALTLDEWVTYLSKMGIGASVVTPMAGGLLTSQER